MQLTKVLLTLVLSTFAVVLFTAVWMAVGPGIHPQPVGRIEFTPLPSQTEAINSYVKQDTGKDCTHKFIARDRIHAFVTVHCSPTGMGELFRLDYDPGSHVISGRKGIFGGEGIYNEVKRLLPKKVFEMIKDQSF